MCNIAGYLGDKQAAPILLEMLRKQQPYDGDMSTGVATIHEGKLYYRKLVGDVDTFLREVDLSELPGTVGIAHTRPAGTPGGTAAHPSFNKEKTFAMVTNGTSPRTPYWTSHWDRAADLLDGTEFALQSYPNPNNKSPKISRNGEVIHMNECKIRLIEYYMSQGMTFTQAMARSQTDIYNENVSVFITEQFPDEIFAIRTTRPMNVIMEKGETYMATTRFGFPEELKNEPVMLPVQYACRISRDGITVTGDKMDIEPVMEMTPYTYAEAYRRFEALLKSEKAPLYFDQLEYAARDEMRDLWPGDHTFVQHARLVYDMLWQFDSEGRLKREMRVQQANESVRHRWYFWLEE